VRVGKDSEQWTVNGRLRIKDRERGKSRRMKAEGRNKIIILE
jgi:hypothetical protein